jgi:hypothetical protein
VFAACLPFVEALSRPLPSPALSIYDYILVEGMKLLEFFKSLHDMLQICKQVPCQRQPVSISRPNFPPRQSLTVSFAERNYIRGSLALTGDSSYLGFIAEMRL